MTSEFLLYIRIITAALAGWLIAGTGCSRTLGTYDDLEKSVAVEQLVRKEYAGFFTAVRTLGAFHSGSSDEPDSALVKKAAKATDRVIADVRPYPTTLQSRLALDALSYAAGDLTVSPGFSHTRVADFWNMALLNPIIVTGREYIRSGKTNVSTHLQIVKALQRGIGPHANVRHFMDILPVFGVVPPREVMSVAEKDTFLFKRIYDLILYSRSLQVAPPPLWMITGPWFCAVKIQGFFPMFFSLVPVIVDNEVFLAIRIHEPGDVYAVAFRDPAPAGKESYDAWLARGSAAMDSLDIDRTFAERVRISSLPAWDAHYFFSDYIVSTDADSIRKEFTVSLKRNRVFEDSFHYAGDDSLTITFSSSQLSRPDSTITVLEAFRQQGAKVYGTSRVPAKSGRGRAYLMPVGNHDEAILRRIVGK
jgi:hypothetical protein